MERDPTSSQPVLPLFGEETGGVRFVHTADWQLGMTRHFLDADAQPRYTAARIDAIEEIGRAAARFGAEFVLVCGDVFESAAVSQRVVSRALAAMNALPMPIYLLPGNHDPLDAASIYRSRAFRAADTDQVRVLDRPGIHQTRSGVEIVAAPWFSKHPRADLVAEAISGVPAGPAVDGVLRIVAGHGGVDVLAGERRDPAQIRLARLEQALAEGQVHYVALGDRHSHTSVGRSGAIRYAGTQEVADVDEVDPGSIALVRIDPAGSVTVQPERVGQWTFAELRRVINGDPDLDALDAELHAVPSADRTVVWLGLTGTVTPAGRARLDKLVCSHRERLAGLRFRELHTDLATVADPGALADLGIGGFIGDAAAELAEVAAGSGADRGTAGAALALLHRLAGGGG